MALVNPKRAGAGGPDPELAAAGLAFKFALALVAAHGRSEDLVYRMLDLAALGSVSIRRASHVEPNSTGHWLADLSPVGGPVLGPFKWRSQALEAEVRWLETQWLAIPTASSPGDPRRPH